MRTPQRRLVAALVRRHAEYAGLARVALEDPFTPRPQSNDEDWMLVLSPTTGTRARSNQ